MNWTQIEGRWNQLKGDAKSTWGKLTDDDLTVIDGKREKLSGIIEERYGVMREDAEKQIDAFLARLKQ